jgi:hypothetical protein
MDRIARLIASGSAYLQCVVRVLCLEKRQGSLWNDVLVLTLCQVDQVSSCELSGNLA